jgi:DNA-binding XRE family transcriptional regulator
MLDFVERQKAWIEDNPLRKFRRTAGATFMLVASALEVSTFTIQNWESGAAEPSAEAMAKIGALLSDDNICATWSEWLGRKPCLA